MLFFLVSQLEQHNDAGNLDQSISRRQKSEVKSLSSVLRLLSSVFCPLRWHIMDELGIPNGTPRKNLVKQTYDIGDIVM